MSYKSLFFLLPLSLCLLSFVSADYSEDPPKEAKETLKWYTWEEAIAANEKEPKKIMIDLYTSWCGWCKKMDKTTFADPKVAAYLSENFYPVKFNAEQKEDIIFNDHTFSYVKNGRRGVHMLAYSLTDGKLSYPSIVYLDGNIKRISISPGFKDAKSFITELKYIGEEHYATKSFQDFQRESNK